MLSPEQYQCLLQQYPVLLALDESTRNTALRHARVVALAQGSTVFSEAKACSGFPFVLSGTIRVFKSSSQGRELPLYRVGVGDACIVSSGCLLSHRPYNASGIVQEAAELVMMPDEDFELLLAHRVFREYVFGLFSERLLELMQLIEEVAFKKLDQRLANLLLGHGKVIASSHQQLADELGSVREMVSRLLKGFAEDGLVVLGREQITILDAAGLRKIAA
jgi:CRP/FNR family transcriptional regulator